MNTTRRHPRTLQEAFGPYCSHHITEPGKRRWGAPVWLALAVLVILMAAVNHLLGA